MYITYRYTQLDFSGNSIKEIRMNSILILFFFFLNHYKLNAFLYVSAICSPSCQNGGTCVSPFKCSCPSGYKGDICTGCKYYLLISNFV